MQSTVGVDNIVLHINLANVDCILAKLTITCLILINAHLTKGILRIVGLASSGGSIGSRITFHQVRICITM